MRSNDVAIVAFGHRLRSCREALGWSQEYLAAEAGLDRTYVSGIERGVRNPSLKNIIRLAAALKVSLATLFEGIDRKQS